MNYQQFQWYINNKKLLNIKEQTLDKYCTKNATLKAVHPENGKLSVSGNQR